MDVVVHIHFHFSEICSDHGFTDMRTRDNNIGEGGLCYCTEQPSVEHQASLSS